MFSPELLAEKVNNFKGRSPHGISCKFIKLDKKWGIKVYIDSRVRNMAFEDQKKMAQHGFAPEVGICFDAGFNYCYLTEVVETLAVGEEYNG